ncbi:MULTISPECIES: MarR family transcriptional regulator [Streptomyces]|uniref:MarR family transcriptional regulator n=1 Tax=Streptomyces solicathayae TaxID=3081768 RepID=A0ABZ0LMS1_9ACTN|nr:MarR family transcriptional regulator [Streptomyces sp. HUAS YS2]WOX20099.1 MarR family transcriptional regulator [Streptomyces sp. HUAS YS2]
MTTTINSAAANATAPSLNARVLALAHYAGRGLLEDVLTRYGVTFHQSVTLRAVAVAGESIGVDALVGDVTGSLKESDAVIRGVIEELTATQVLEADPADATRVRLTDAGRDLYERTSAESAKISARLYADIPAEDLAVAGRVLTLITQRANAEAAAG